MFDTEFLIGLMQIIFTIAMAVGIVMFFVSSQKSTAGVLFALAFIFSIWLPPVTMSYSTSLGTILPMRYVVPWGATIPEKLQYHFYKDKLVDANTKELVLSHRHKEQNLWELSNCSKQIVEFDTLSTYGNMNKLAICRQENLTAKKQIKNTDIANLQ